MELIVTTPEDLQQAIQTAVESAFENQPKVSIEPVKNLHSIKELADFLGCSTVKAMQLKNSGRIRFYQDRRKVIFVPSEILEDLKPVRK
ncbi:MAG TPA: DUF3853 family protein [Ignavibacteria bacterium]|nr:DUF3853 family protein [Ignavibacteria bacterium]